jgi:hypothetical protein
MEYLKVWKAFLTKFTTETSSYEYPIQNIAKCTLHREISDEMSESKAQIYTELNIPLSRWDSYYPNSLTKFIVQ